MKKKTVWLHSCNLQKWFEFYWYNQNI